MRGRVTVSRLANVSYFGSNQVSYICPRCRLHNQRRHIYPTPMVRAASSDSSLSERLRRKLWGTNNPPGAEDPYVVPGNLERMQMPKQDKPNEHELPVLEHGNPAGDDSRLLPEVVEGIQDRQYQADRWEYPRQGDLAENAGYVPAESWDGLKRVGNTGRWQDQPPTETDDFRPFFGMRIQATTDEQFLSALHQGVVEIFTLRDASFPPPAEIGYVPYTPETMTYIANTAIKSGSSDGLITLDYPENARDSILGAIEAVTKARKAGRQLTGTGHESLMTYTHMRPPHYPVSSRKFLSLALDDLSLRFAIAKRVSQLIGQHIPDPVLTESTRLNTLYNYLKRQGKPKSKKLAPRLTTKDDLVSLPNVSIASTKRTAIHRDKTLGRFKIIEAELLRRGLPALGKQKWRISPASKRKRKRPEVSSS